MTISSSYRCFSGETGGLGDGGGSGDGGKDEDKPAKDVLDSASSCAREYFAKLDAETTPPTSVDTIPTAIAAHVNANANAAFNAGEIVACGYWDGKIRIFEYKVKFKGRLLAVLKYHDSSVTDVAFAPDESFRAWRNLTTSNEHFFYGCIDRILETVKSL